MSKRKLWFIIIGGLVIIGLGILVYIRIQQNLSNSNSRGPNAPIVNLSNPTVGTITKKLSYSGDILPLQQANIYSRVNGNVRHIYNDIGDFVTKGKLLATIDNSVYLQTVRQTEAALNQARATFQNNKTNLERYKMLLDKGLATQYDYDNAETTLKVSTEQIQLAEANYNNALLQLDYCNIRAPFSGYITKRFLDVGTLVAANSQSASNIIFTITDMTIVKIMVNVLEKDLPVINVTDVAEVKTSAYANEIFSGKIKKFTQSVDLTTRTMPVEIDILNKYNRLKPGMYATIDVILDVKPDSKLIPVQCVLKDDKGNYVYTVNTDSTAVKKYIEIGDQQDNNYEIISGLTESDKFVSLGQQLCKDGGKVKIK